MWQSYLRIVFALLITAVGASLLIGTVSAQGPAPEVPVLEPPGGRGPDAPRPSEPPPPSSGGVIERGSVDVRMTTVPSASANEINSNIAMSSDYRCAYVKYTQRRVFWSKTEWCFDGTYIVRGHPVMTKGTKTHAYTTATANYIETAKRPIVWKVSGGFQHQHHRDRGLADLVVCITPHYGPIEQVCETYSNELSIEKWQFGTGFSRATGDG